MEKEYLDFCDKVFSHIRVKETRDYYIKNHPYRTTDIEYILMLIYYGYYSIEEKAKLLDELTCIKGYFIDKQMVFSLIMTVSNEYRVAYENFSDDDSSNIVWAINPVVSGCSCDYDYDFNQSIDDINTIYATSFAKAKQIINQIRESVLDKCDCSRFYLDKITPNNRFDTCSSYRYTIDIIDGEIVPTNYYTIFHTFRPQNPLYYAVHMLDDVFRLGFNHGDKVMIKTPLMDQGITGFLYDADHEIDSSLLESGKVGDGGCSYSIVKDINDDDHNYIYLRNVMPKYNKSGFLSVDWVTKVEEDH